MRNHDSKHQPFVIPLRCFRVLHKPVFISIILCSLLLILAACGQNVPNQPGVANAAPPMTKRLTTPEGGVISFNASTSYATALRIVTNLGLQLSIGCLGPTMPWQPIGSKDYFKVSHSISTSGKIGGTPTVTYNTDLPTIIVVSTPLTPVNWQARLLSTPQVAKIKRPLIFHCPLIPIKLPPGMVGSLPQKQAGTYVNMHFASNVNYDDALYTAQNNGLRLANYCYEHEPGLPADWSPMSQDQPFAHAHTLVVATTILSPTDWAKRMARTKGITSLQYPFSSACS